MKLLSRTIATVSFVACAVAGCSLAPHFQRPELPVPPAFSVSEKNDAAKQKASAIAQLPWRSYFKDTVLQQLIAMALENNRDLRQAALAVKSYQAQYRISRSAQWPTVMAGMSGTKQRAYSLGQYASAESYSASVGVTAFELDLFNRLGDLKENAWQQYLAMAENERAVRISLIAEVARAYLTLLADQEKLSISRDTFTQEEQFTSLTELRQREGIDSQLVLVQARTVRETARANLAISERQVTQDKNALAVFVGAPLPPMANSLLKEHELLPEETANLSSSVLLNRPDIAAAEHQLRGAYAAIGAARAAFFPSISLTANGGYASDQLSNLFESASGVWLFSPAVNVPIFTAGRLSAQLDVAKLNRDSLIAAYEKAIETAFREVADALVACGSYRDQADAQEKIVQAAKQYYDLALDRYQQGLDSYLTLLDAQRTLFAARQNLVSLRLAQMGNQVDLYKALGGGLVEDAKSVPAVAPAAVSQAVPPAVPSAVPAQTPAAADGGAVKAKAGK
ncbi:MAG: efflux transporter outer membrane subunit [Desulfobulbaceae bacterium]|jgi:multidrug efflux system outer membrane protein|nr:efflux transporter outer membrane subunit [Desulfobulbaceae bacterium]